MAPLADADLVGALLTFARILPICALVAASTRAIVPWPIALSIALSLVLPFSTPVDLPLVSMALLAGAGRELCVGLVFALATVLPLLGLGWGARLAEHGGALPVRSQAGPVPRLYALVAVSTFLALSGHRALLMALSASFRDVPLGPLGLDRAAFALGLSALAGEAMAFALALALPLWLALWVAQAVVALSARALGLRPEGMDGALRAPLGVLVAAALLAPLAGRVPDAVRQGLTSARDVIDRMLP